MVITEKNIGKHDDIEPNRSDIIIGAIAGDIIGSPYEFNSIKTTDFPLFSERSRFTDDTVMTIAVLNALLEYQEQTNIGGLEGLLWDIREIDWEKLNQLFITSMKAFGRAYPDAGYGSRFRKWLIGDSNEPYNSFGNGSAMRVSPVGALFCKPEIIDKVAEASAATTHNHPEGIKGAKAVADTIFHAKNRMLATKEKKDIKDIIKIKYGYNFYRTIDKIRPDYKFDATCQGSVPEAIICFFEGESFEEVVRLAVSLGGDSDTQASIAGAIAAARYGVPKKIKTEVIKRLPEDLLAVYYRFDEETNPEKLEQKYLEFQTERKSKISPELYAKIIRYLEEWKSQTTPDIWAELRETNPIDCHFTLGMWIRNTYLYKDEATQDEFRAAGYMEPDSMSEVILEIWIDELNK